MSLRRPEIPRTDARAALLLAAVAILLLQRFVPYGRLMLYPFTLLSTWVHEMGHGVTAMLLGGRFLRLDIFADASGLAHHTSTGGLRDGLVAAGGLLAPPLAGALMLLLARRMARPLLWGVALLLFLSMFVWIRTPVGWLTVGGLGVLFVLVAHVCGHGGRLFFAQLCGLLFALDTITRIDYLFTPSARVGGELRPSDVGQMAQALGASYLVWGGLCAGLSALLLLIGLYSVLRGSSASARSLPGIGADASF